MKKVAILFCFLTAYFFSTAQGIILKPNNSFGMEYNRILPDTLLGVPKDTFAVATALRSYPWLAAKGDSMYLWSRNLLKWILYSGGGSGSGTVNSGAQYRLGIYVTAGTGTTIGPASAITANRALISDANGVPTHSTVTNTELSYSSGVTSSIQTQLNARELLANKATNFTTLNNTLYPTTQAVSDRIGVQWHDSAVANTLYFDGTTIIGAGTSGDPLHTASGIGANLSNASLTANGNYTHDWTNHYSTFNNVGGWLLNFDALGNKFIDLGTGVGGRNSGFLFENIDPYGAYVDMDLEGTDIIGGLYHRFYARDSIGIQAADIYLRGNVHLPSGTVSTTLQQSITNGNRLTKADTINHAGFDYTHDSVGTYTLKGNELVYASQGGTVRFRVNSSGALSIGNGAVNRFHVDTDGTLDVNTNNGSGTPTSRINVDAGATTATISLNNSNLKLTTAPTTSAGGYDILTRNTSTDIVEKVASSTFAPASGSANYIQNGTSLQSSSKFNVSDDSYVNGIRIGRGNGSVASNMIVGYNVAPNMNSDTSNSNVLIGVNACQNCTAVRESVIIGSGYGSFVRQASDVETGLSTIVGAGAAAHATQNNVNAFGQKALINDTLGGGTSAFGNHVALGFVSGSSNAFFGNEISNDISSGGISGTANAFFGYSVSRIHGTKNYNTALGGWANENAGTGDDNTYVGFTVAQGDNNAGFTQTGNTAIGSRAMNRIQSGTAYNNAFGYQAGYNISTGRNNVIISSDSTGDRHFSTITSGHNNLVIGNNITVPSGTASNQLNIKGIIFATGANATGTSTAGKVGIGNSAPSYKLDVTGSVHGDSVLATSILLPPQVTITQRNTIASPTTGMQVINTDDGWPEYYDSFWGWMPLSESTEWKAKYGTSWHDPLTSQASMFTRRTSGSGSNTDFTNVSGGLTGCVRLATGSTTTGYAQLHSQDGGSTAGYVLGSGTISYTHFMLLDQLSNATDEFIYFGGFGNTIAAPGQTQGVFFTYDRAGGANGTTAQTVWQCVTRNASTSTVTNTSVTVAASTVYKLTILINAAASSVTFKINDVTVATHTTNIPSGGGVQRTQHGIYKTAGTTGVTARVWDAMFKEKFTTAR